MNSTIRRSTEPAPRRVIADQHSSPAAPAALQPSQAEPRSAAAKPLRRYHFHLPGLVYILVTLFIAVGAINSQNNLLFGALGLAIGGLLISGIVSGGALLGLRISRSLPNHLPLGEPLRIAYRVKNANRLLPTFGIHLEELPVHREIAKSRVNWPAFVNGIRSFVVQVPPKGSVEAIATVIPRRRGRLSLGVLHAWTTFPFGLVKKSVAISLPEGTLIHPPILPLRRGLLRQLVSRSPFGQNAARTPGMGDEFFGLREYVPGDSQRRIAWKRSARTGELVVRQNAMPAPHRLWVILRLVGQLPSEGRAEAGRRAALNERAITLAASLLAAASEAEVAIGLAIPGLPSASDPDGRGAGFAAPRLGRPHLDRLLRELALLEADAIAPAGFPEAAARSGACVMIDAASADRSYSPPHAVRFPASDAQKYLEPSETVRRTLAIFDAVPAPAPARRWRALMRGLVRAAGGSA